MDEELREIEAKLEQLAPEAMPDDMLARMEQAMERWQEFVPVEEKIVPFKAEPKEKGRLKFFNAWASAAAVALIAATSFIVFSGGESATPTLVNNFAEEPVAMAMEPTENIKNVVSASNTQFDTQVTRASSGAIAYDAKGRPMRVMQVDFEDEVTIRGRDGKIYKVKQPRIEYYAVPLEIH